MRDIGQLYFATSKEIHDILFSAKQKMTDSVLHDLLRDRGIICSPLESREALSQYLALLPHDYSDVCGILDRRESFRRIEKTAAVVVRAELTVDELKEIACEYQQEETAEVVRSNKRSASEFVMDVTYPEYDYSKTRLLQRQDRDAEILFVKRDGCVEIRMPATEKARSIVDKIMRRIEIKKNTKLGVEEIELTKLTSPEERTTFFTKLISTIPDLSLETVSRLRVAHSHAENDSEDIDIDGVGDVEEKMLGVVENVALTGNNLVASEMYQELKEKGFFITTITWRVKQKTDPFSIYELSAGFDDRLSGKNFWYTIHGKLRFKDGRYTKTIRPVDDDEKVSLLTMIEHRARVVLTDLIDAGSQANKTGGS